MFAKTAFASAFMLILLFVAANQQTVFANVARVFSFEALFDCSNILMETLVLLITKIIQVVGKEIQIIVQKVYFQYVDSFFLRNAAIISATTSLQFLILSKKLVIIASTAFHDS